MTYFLADASGYRCDIASIGGLRTFSEWAPKVGPVREFLNRGVTEDPKALAKALVSLKAKDPAVESIRKALLKAACTADEILILSDGVG